MIKLTDLGTKRRELAMFFRLYVMMKFRLDLERPGVDFKHWKFNHFLPPYNSARASYSGWSYMGCKCVQRRTRNVSECLYSSYDWLIDCF